MDRLERELELESSGLEAEPAGGGGGVPGNTIGPPVGTCDANRRLHIAKVVSDKFDTMGIRQNGLTCSLC